MPTKVKTKTTSAKKGTIKKSAQKRALVCAEGEQCFWTTDGNIIGNLVELRDRLNEMADEVFAHHVTKERNDFANWINDVLNDAELAQAIRKAKKAQTARLAIVRSLREYDI
jgi:hypothetical protein